MSHRRGRRRRRFFHWHHPPSLPRKPSPTALDPPAHRQNSTLLICVLLISCVLRSDIVGNLTTAIVSVKLDLESFCGGVLSDTSRNINMTAPSSHSWSDTTWMGVVATSSASR